MTEVEKKNNRPRRSQTKELPRVGKISGPRQSAKNPPPSRPPSAARPGTARAAFRHVQIRVGPRTAKTRAARPAGSAGPRAASRAPSRNARTLGWARRL